MRAKAGVSPAWHWCSKGVVPVYDTGAPLDMRVKNVARSS